MRLLYTEPAITPQICTQYVLYIPPAPCNLISTDRSFPRPRLDDVIVVLSLSITTSPKVSPVT